MEDLEAPEERPSDERCKTAEATTPEIGLEKVTTPHVNEANSSFTSDVRKSLCSLYRTRAASEACTPCQLFNAPK
jgi:hypothetical protein